MQSAADRSNSTRIMKRNNPRSRICFRIEQNYIDTILTSETENNDCKPIYTLFIKLYKLVLNKKKRNIVCSENKNVKCKKCYCVCCQVERKSKLVSAKTTSTPPWS